MHAVCAGIWRAEEWQLTHDVDQTFSFLKCSGCSGSVSCMKKAMGTIGSLKRREIEEKKAIEQRRREKEEYVTNGPTRSSLEKVWKKYGADVCAFKQTFCGNHVYKLLHTRQRPTEIGFATFLLALGDVMKLCVSSALTECEMDELEDGIARIWESLQNCAPHGTITPKLHMLMEHVMPFVKEHKTWAKTCEQSIEAFHAVFNRLKIRQRSTVEKKKQLTLIFRSLLYLNQVAD
uniref:Uncharacterized protein n=1 Tax=Caenorhabditis japonica TaxID=281687 RepID=A0A8R1EGG3_CAEJA